MQLWAVLQPMSQKGRRKRRGMIWVWPGGIHRDIPHVWQIYAMFMWNLTLAMAFWYQKASKNPGHWDGGVDPRMLDEVVPRSWPIASSQPMPLLLQHHFFFPWPSYSDSESMWKLMLEWCHIDGLPFRRKRASLREHDDFIKFDLLCPKFEQLTMCPTSGW
jgi:hypothetical protein